MDKSRPQSRSGPDLLPCPFCGTAPRVKVWPNDPYNLRGSVEVSCENNYCPVQVSAEENSVEAATANWNARIAAASEKLASTAYPDAGRLIQAYTPTTYPGRHENLPPPYVNFSEAKTPYEETLLTVRSPHKSDGSAGDVGFIVITNYELQKLLLRVARWRGWLPMTEEQWQLQHYLDSPEEAQRARERIEQLKRQRDEARRMVEETTAALAGIPTPP